MGSGLNRPVVAALVGAAALLGGLGLGMLGADTATVVEAVGPRVTVSQLLDVHVAGWVGNPGVVQVPAGSIVADAISAAGGLRPGAGVEAINLAATLADGDQVVVPGPSQAPSVDPAQDGPLSLNRATAGQLQDLPGVGPVLAQRIVDHRDANGRFETVEDLLEVPGIGEAKLAGLRDLVRP